ERFLTNRLKCWNTTAKQVCSTHIFWLRRIRPRPGSACCMRSTAHDNEVTASLKSARRTLVLLLAGMVLMLLLPSASIAQINAYLPLHMALETGAIIAAAMIFVMGWHTISIRPNYRLLVMACCFLGVALLDFAHMIFFEGMPRVV